MLWVYKEVQDTMAEFRHKGQVIVMQECQEEQNCKYIWKELKYQKQAVLVECKEKSRE